MGIGSIHRANATRTFRNYARGLLTALAFWQAAAERRGATPTSDQAVQVRTMGPDVFRQLNTKLLCARTHDSHVLMHPNTRVGPLTPWELDPAGWAGYVAGDRAGQPYRRLAT